MVSVELRELIVANTKAGIRVDEISRVLQVENQLYGGF